MLQELTDQQPRNTYLLTVFTYYLPTCEIQIISKAISDFKYGRFFAVLCHYGLTKTHIKSEVVQFFAECSLSFFTRENKDRQW